MAISFNHGENPLEINYNNNGSFEVYYNHTFVGPRRQSVFYKFELLDHIQQRGVNENTYALYLSNYQVDSTYIQSYITDKAPAGQQPQKNVVNPKGTMYATPLSFVRRVVIAANVAPLTPMYMNHGFDHLYGGLNNLEGMKEEYPFEGVDFNKLDVGGTTTLEAVFYRCHAPYIDVSSGDTRHVLVTKDLFKNCSAEHIYIGNNGNLDNVEVYNSKDMFKEAYNLPNFQSGKVDKTKAKLVENGGYLERRPG